MLDISNGKVVRVIFLAREYGPDSWHLRDYISGLNEDEQVSLVAIMWIGRDSFSPDEVDEALATARAERTAPTEDYLSGIPELPDYLEAGLEALGIDVTDAEDRM
ncbi:DUF3775 domain-containing protein [Palleronia sp. KMU-117]|uniref:DUF3775 domain-containing protein n=1 Tax=Palleronia sp. KMU-117 TaxID=3434108 RepID=UPI003D763751